MRQACIDAVNAALAAAGRTLTVAEARGIEQRVAGHRKFLARKDPAAWRALSAADQLAAAGKSAADELNAEAAKKKQRIILGAIRMAANEDYANSQIAAGHDRDGLDAMQRKLTAKNDFHNNTLSVESLSNGMTKVDVADMAEVFDAVRPGLWRTLTRANRTINRQMYLALAGVTKGVSPRLIKAAKLFHDLAEAKLQRFNAAGGNVGRLDNWDLPHAWSPRLAQAKGFVDDLMNWVDRSVYVHENGRAYTDAELRDFLTEARLSIVSDGLNSPGQSFPGGSVKANRHRAHRQIHLKPEHVAEAMTKYTDRNVMEAMVSHLRQMNRDIALIETFGPNADAQFAALIDKFTTQATRAAGGDNAANAGRLRGKARYLQRMYDHLAGNNPPPESPLLSDTMAAFRSQQIAAKLGSAVITSIGDSATLAQTAHMNNINQFRVFFDTLHAWNPGGRRWAKRAGLLTDTVLGEANRFAMDNMTARELGSQAASFFIRASGLNFMTEVRRTGFGAAMMDAAGHLSRRYADVTKLKPGDFRALSDAGVTQEIWNVWRAAKLESRGADFTLLTPDAIRAVPNVDPKLKQRATEALLAIVSQETDLAVVQPGVRERTQMSLGAESNSKFGEIARTATLFKSFPWAFMQRHWERGASFGLGGRIAYFAANFALMTTAGQIALWINDIRQGKDPRSINFWSGASGRQTSIAVRNVLAATLKGGGLGFFGDFLFSETTQYGGQGLAEAAGGPAVGTLGEMARLGPGNAVQALAGEETNIGAEAIQFARSNTPGANTWYLSGLLDKAVTEHWQEMASPGYVQKRTANAIRRQNTSYWWRPGEDRPDRLPDLAHAFAEE